LKKFVVKSMRRMASGLLRKGGQGANAGQSGSAFSGQGQVRDVSSAVPPLSKLSEKIYQNLFMGAEYEIMNIV
jgi:hypothetical protein